ncbi:MAG: EamA family transporter [Candidatus Nanohaloarchaea archaeon]
MAEWFVFAVIGMLGSGFQNFGYKLAAEKGCNSATLLSSFIGTGALLAYVMILFMGAEVGNIQVLIGLALANALAYVVRFLARQEAHKLVPLVWSLPLMKMSTGIVAVLGVIFLGETMSKFNAFGVLVSLAVIWILGTEREGGDFVNVRKGALFIFIVIVAAVAGSFVVKFASGLDKFVFIALSYSMMFFMAFPLQKRFSNLSEATSRTAIKWGSIIGGINFLSFTSLLTALEEGPISIVFPLFSLGMAVSVAMSTLILDEKLNLKRILGFFAAIFALVLLRI